MLRPFPMNSDPKYPCRKSIRLSGYDYSQSGMYFVTICTHKKECLFGEIVNGEMRLNDIGRVVVDEWLKTPQIRDEIDLDQWVIMPNHFHAIIFIHSADHIICKGDRPVAQIGDHSIDNESRDQLVH